MPKATFLIGENESNEKAMMCCSAMGAIALPSGLGGADERFAAKTLICGWSDR
ncbi:hypothetical protein [Thermosynechococcus sp.]|uniref:hypothetical protein n=1 Tax=Thermosynechococcus sp. TaxID=2814275 RepID=UPI00391BB85F